MAGLHLERDVFCCSVCSNLLTNPMAIPCGHCFCMSCINNHLDQEDHVGIYSCPRCREIFVKRPVLVKNTMIAVVVDEMRKTEVHTPLKLKKSPVPLPGQPKKHLVQAPAEVTKPFVQDLVSVDDCYAGPEDVACDVCSERKFKAVKSCLQCLVSYCGTHLQPHNDVPPLRKHKLVEATAYLQESICSQHQEVMKMFCRTDQRCICYVCSKDGHHGHAKVSIEAERIERQKELQSARQRIQRRIQERGKDLSVFQQEEDAINEFTDNALVNTEKVFTEIIHTVEKKLSHIKESLQSRQNSEMGRFTTVRDKVEKEIYDLNRRDAKLDELSRTENHIHFVVNFPSLSHLDDSKCQPTHRFRRQRNFEKVTVAVAEARNKLQEALNEEYEKIQNAITGTNGLPSAAHAEQEAAVFEPSHEPVKTTAEFVQSRILQNLTSPAHSPPYVFKNGDGIMQDNGNFADTHVLKSKWHDNSNIKSDLKPNRQNFSQVRDTPEPKEQNFSPIRANFEPRGQDLLMTRITTPFDNPQFSEANANINLRRGDLAAAIATPSRNRHKFSKVKNDFFDPDDFMQKNKGSARTSSRLVRSKSQIGSNNLEIEKPSPHALLARASTTDKLNNLQNRANFLKYAQDITLDPSTANPHLAVTNEKREAVFVGEELAYPSHPDRFAYSWQVLSRECITGRCYLEVERSGKGVMVALAYKNISRAGTFNECMFGQNKKSWALDCYQNSGEFRHDAVKTSIPGICSSRIGVYLDHSDGIICFYSVSETMTLLHRVQTTFTHPLHLGLWLSDGASAKVCKFT